MPLGKPRSSREKFTQLTANMGYLYPQPQAGPTPTYLLPVDILGVVRDDGLAGHVMGTTQPQQGQAPTILRVQEKRESVQLGDHADAASVREKATTSSGLRPNPAHIRSPDDAYTLYGPGPGHIGSLDFGHIPSAGHIPGHSRWFVFFLSVCLSVF